ncbi:hypothetical protein E0L36_01290 [Streptomyces sp. AJS327]|uniref:hypothetical protein n=1 Tax=Streptomyces sp. AJS327 TaxID=2545265 RepID=UPI0015DFD748|nr:hypothetical protein [Streptomyces sp. AJS327]MBA0049591.1 hypothetical protein [Streptomyces sp. AJS327]
MRRSKIVGVVLTASAIPLVLACSAVEKALDCGKTALVVAEAADDLQRAVSDATEDPTEARESLDRIDRNLEKISDETDDADVGKAVESLESAVQSVRQDLKQGDTPKAGPVGDAADDLTAVCKPG